MATMNVEYDDEDTTEIIKSEICSIKNCTDFATENMCRIGMCKKHHAEAMD